MTSLSEVANIIIENNIIDQGKSFNGTSTITYNYAHNAWIYGSAIIEKNSFLNPAASADMLNITDGSCIIRNNKFIRGTTVINSYIKHRYVAASYSGIDQITDNIFDQSTTNNIADEELVKGLNPGSTYTRNKNQTGFIYIPIYDNTLGAYPETLASSSAVANTYAVGFQMSKSGNKNLITLIQQANFTVDDPQLCIVNRTFQLGDYLEKGMEVTSVRVGGFRFGVGTLTDFGAGSSFSITRRSHLGTSNMDATKYATLTPAISFTGSYDINSSSKFTDLSTSTQFTSGAGGGGGGADGDFNGFVRPDYWRIGNGYHVEVEFNANITFDTSIWRMTFTPIEVKYIW